MIPVTLIHGGDIQATQYPIQKANDQDVLQFRLELEPNSKVPPIFEVTNKEIERVKDDRSVLGLVKNMDSDYQQVLTNMKDLRRSTKSLEFKAFDSFGSMDEAVRTQYSGGLRDASGVRTPNDVRNEDTFSYKELLADQKENQTKTMEMISDFSHKTMAHMMFMSNIKVIGTAVTQVSQGFKTLFRSSG